MIRCFVGVGTNVDKVRNLQLALHGLKAHFEDIQRSAVYETLPVGFEGETFFNLVVSFQTFLLPEQVANTLRQLEIKQGYQPEGARFVPRPIDLDLLLYGDHIINTPTFKLPRKDIEEYPFVLQPLAEMVPNLKHPIHQVTYQQMLKSRAMPQLKPCAIPIFES